MTLALCTVFQGQAFLLSDLRLSYELERNPGPGEEPPDSALKSFFLNPELAVAYSGTTQAAHIAVTEARQLSASGTSTTEIAEFLRVACQQNNDDIEFLLADANNPATIYKIRANQLACAQTGIFWIGDKDAADLVLGCDHHNNPFALDRCFQEALDSQRIPTIGGIVVTACGTANGFKFVPKMALTSPYYRAQADGEWHAVNWGNAAAGGFGYTTLVPVEPGRNGWGVHFFQGHLGYFYRVDIDQNIGEKLTWNNTEPQNAIDGLQAELGFAVESSGQLGVTPA